MFERFTDDARRVVVYAQEESRLLRHEHIGTEHILLGLLHGDTTTAAALGEVGVELAGARARIGQSQGLGKKETHGHIPFTQRAKQVLEQSLHHARRLGNEQISRPHLLRALLDVQDCVAVRTLVAYGVDLGALAERADDLASAVGPETTARPPADTAVARFAPRPRWRARRLRYRRGPRTGGDVAAGGEAFARPGALARALCRYVHHHESCDRQQGCTCGLQKLLDELDSLD